MACKGRMRHSYPKEGPKMCVHCGHNPETNRAVEISHTPNTVVEVVEIVPAASPSIPDTAPATEATTLAPPASPPPELPAHSPLGASSAERWMNCPGSTILIANLQRTVDDEVDPDWRKEGILGHEAAAECLTKGLDAWELLGTGTYVPEKGYKEDVIDAVQVYLNYIRSREGCSVEVEKFLHRPEIHELAYGRLDCVMTPLLGEDHAWIEIVDLKLGIGVPVYPRGNVQAMYYAALYIAETEKDWDDNTPVRITIAQPRAVSESKPPIMSWETNVGTIKAWVRLTLVPKMEATRDELNLWFELGEHCRFCPAKTACPAYDNLVTKAKAGGKLTIDEIDNLAMLIKQRKNELMIDLQNGMDPAEVGAKLVFKRVDRVWKHGADAAAIALFGDAATETKALGPARIEKLPQGKTFVQEWAYKPEAGYNVVSLKDERSAVRVPQASELHGALVQNFVDSPAIEW